MSGKRRAIKTAVYQEGKHTGSLQSECDAFASEYYVKSLPAAAVWERFSVTRTRVEMLLQAMIRLPLFPLLTTCHFNCFTLSQVPEKEFELAKGNAQVIKPKAHTYTHTHATLNVCKPRSSKNRSGCRHDWMHMLWTPDQRKCQYEWLMQTLLPTHMPPNSCL